MKNSEAPVHRAPGLDFLRAMAVTLVIVFHFANNSGGAFPRAFAQHGWMGVDLFFVLSGFLIGNQVFKALSLSQPFSFMPFLIRRSLRTLPAYLLVLAVYFFFPPWRERPSIAPLWKFLTFTLNIGLSREATSAFTHAWSLCVEEQFYFFFPIAVWLWAPRAKGSKITAFLIGLVIAGLLLRSLLWIRILQPAQASVANFGSLYDQYLYYPTFSHLDGLLVGIALSLTKVFRPSRWTMWLRHPSRAMALAASSLGMAVWLSFNKFSLMAAAFLYPSVALSAGALLIVFVSPGNALSRIRVPGIATLATLSYGIYLLQKLVFQFCLSLLPQVGVGPFSSMGFALTMILCVIFAALLHVLVEQPFMKWRDRLLAKTRVGFFTNSGSEVISELRRD